MLVLLVVVVALAGVAVPAASFSTADVPRGTSVSVAEDPNGVLGLDRAERVQRNNRERLVTVTNNFGGEATVTVSLVNGGGTLYADGKDGQSVMFTVYSGTPTDVEIEASENGRLTYRISGTADGTTFELTRSIEVRGGGPPKCAGPPNQRPSECKNSGGGGPPDDRGPPN